MLAFFLFASSWASQPTELLEPCPDSPNCVSTLASDERHAIAPMSFTESVEEAQARMKRIVGDMKRTELVEERPGYLHFTFTTAVFRFVDDVELVFTDDGTVHFRSASRVGYSDLGVNRRRMEKVREAWVPSP